MVRLGGVAHAPYIQVFDGIRKHFQRHDIDLDWVLYRNWDALVDAFVIGEVDLAWNGPLAYVKIKDRLTTPCQVVAMRDTDVDFKTQFITHPASDIATVEDLKGKSFAFASRGSVQASLLAHHYLKQSGINIRHDLKSTFSEERGAKGLPDEEDVIQRVSNREYDAGSVCKHTLDGLKGEGRLPEVRVFWSSPGYSHCCFSAQSGLDAELSRRITEAFMTITNKDQAGQAVLEGEHCSFFIPGRTEGWEDLENAAREEGLI